MKLVDYESKLRKPLRQATLCFLIREGEILLAMKKRGFAEGKINGVGGKVNDGESVEEAARREVEEEIGVKVNSLKQMAVIDFYFSHNIDWGQQVVVFEVREWDGNPIETEEMAPKWYPLDNIPYENMWIDDIHWLPKVLEGKKVEASFLFDEKENILDHSIKEL